MREADVSGFDPEFAEIRFGCGLSPVVAPAESPQAMLAGLRAPDEMAEQFPIESFDDFRPRMIASTKLRNARRRARGTPQAETLRKEHNLLKKAAREAMAVWFGQTMLRRAYTPSGFRERLVYFWSDHFTARGKAGVIQRATSPYIEEAIRPHFGGRFADLLIAAVTHPVMQQFLDQDRSAGPNSPRALKSGGKQGLNENLAREVLELHTLGVGGPYAQDDVRELAELFTGMSFQPAVGFKFRKDQVEPGAETVLGVTYPDTANMDPIRQVLTDLARHPATARHIARKLAVHFVSDSPAPELVGHLEAVYLESEGDLMAVYAALLDHPAAWEQPFGNVKLPVDFVASALRALAVPPSAIQGLKEIQTRGWFLNPMTLMGQRWQQPIGPDGWAEEDAEWITPQGLAARVQWAMSTPQRLFQTLPDPREFVGFALGSHAPGEVVFAAGAAESRSEAIGLVLSAPRFQRR